MTEAQTEAQTTWALIVGIDLYDDKSIPELQGAVADALAAYRWLRRLDVPDQQILIHASPSQAVRADLDKIRPGCPPARSTDIDDSLIRLEEEAGSRLFVFLFGHGIFEPTSRRLFLTQEFKQKQPMNMGLDLFIPRFLEMPFARQFLFMDGCQNLPYSQTERQKIAGSMFGGRTGFNPRPGNGLVACYAASKDQLALEVGGRGLFSRHLFEALDPGNPLAEAVDLDFATGIRTVDLRKVFFEHVQKKVRDEAWNQSPRMDQEPEIEPHGTARAEETHPVFRLSDERTAAIQVRIDPPAAAAHIRRVRIFAEEPPQWDLRVPRLEGGPLSLPVTSRFPLGLRVTAQCSVRSGGLWKPDPPRYDFEVEEDKTLTFQMRDDSREGPDRSLGSGTRSAPEPEPDRKPAGSYSGAAEDGEEILRVRTRSTRGATIANTFSYEDVAQSLGLPGDSPAWRSEIADGVWMEHHETGPDFVVERGRRESGHRLAKGWAQAIQRMTPPEVVVSFEAPASSEEGPVLRLELPPGGAKSLAGFVTGRSVVWMGHPGDEPREPLWRQLTTAGKRKPGLRLSLDDLERKPERLVEPGPTRVRLDLPWGSWASLVRVPESGEAMITLPATVGTPPLRVVLAPEAGRRETLILGAEAEAPVARLRRGLG
ncbi:MAG TPA: hypothetical protein VL025_09285, partial [Thermoanaerobaculia bacterium]|nr:hypothetical protein [Thermoanaerobaculia bacterium]